MLARVMRYLRNIYKGCSSSITLCMVGVTHSTKNTTNTINTNRIIIDVRNRQIVNVPTGIRLSTEASTTNGNAGTEGISLIIVCNNFVENVATSATPSSNHSGSLLSMSYPSYYDRVHTLRIRPLTLSLSLSICLPFIACIALPPPETTC
jgi:hypothetical protein